MIPLPAKILSRLCESPYQGLLRSRDLCILITEVTLHQARAHTLFIRDGLPGIRPGAPAHYAGHLRADTDAFLAMMARQPPPTPVVLELGNQPGNPRILQAVGLIVAAALGWAGPWPDPQADPEHHRLLRRALLDLSLGPEDERCYLGKAGGPQVRIRQTLTGISLCTEGLSDDPLVPELSLLSPTLPQGIARLRQLSTQLLRGPPPAPVACTPLPLACHRAELWSMSLE